MAEPLNTVFKTLKITLIYNKIYYKASKTLSVNSTNYISFHIELSYKMRKIWFKNGPPKKAYVFCDYLIEGLKFLILRNCDYRRYY